FRRDLRWHDNRSLHAALTSGLPVVPLFVFDANILNSLDDRDDARVTFLHQTVSLMAQEAQSRGSGLLVAQGTPSEIMKCLLETGHLRAVYANEDYEPYADERDGEVSLLLGGNDVAFHTFTDHVVQAPGEVVKPDGNPYTVFTPFSKRWHANLKEEHLRAAPSEGHLDQLLQWSAPNLPTFKDLGFEPSDIAFPDAQVDLQVVRNYAETRDIPSVRGTSRISVHLRFGTLSIREAAKLGFKHSDKWLTELIWRDFYQAIMRAFPHSMIQAFKPQYDRVPWRHDDAHFEAWKNGKTGYPLVDAGMRELLATGFMHNRVRMVVASFLCKHLLLDWRLGERHFAKHLLDFELASNVGGWQWAAGSGCDAAPYFRVFNPTSQLEKFDPDCAYVKTWVPEWGTSHYPAPIVEHKMARQRAIDTYKAALT
ncbi:MAG: deoxyribodipyrimidine photo-lyase, partial [Flavobacteriales bacterium]|nr:deoxyribodipyrimidine photo-lyase [Flavobacteriales bacterium]